MARVKPPYPRLQFSDPLTRGLALALPLTEGSGPIHDFSVNAIAGAAHGPTWTVGRAGGALVNSSVSDYYDTGLSSFGSPEGTVLWSLLPTFSPSDGVARLLWGQSPGAAAPEFSCQKFSDNNWYVGWNTSTDRRVVLGASTANLTQNTWQDYAFSWDATGSRLYHNGMKIGSNATPPIVQNLSGTMYFFGDNGLTGVGLSAGSMIDYFAYFTRSLKDSEIAAWSVDPWRWCRNKGRVLRPASVPPRFMTRYRYSRPRAHPSLFQ